MKVVLYTDADKTGSCYLMTKDLEEELVKLGHEAVTVTAQKDIGQHRPDLLLNFWPKDIIQLQKTAGRYYYCGKIVTVFTPSLEVFSDPQLAYMLISAKESPIVAHSKAIYDALVVEARRLFAPAILREILKSLHSVNYGVRDIFTAKKRKGEALNWYVAPMTRCTSDKGFEVHQGVSQRLKLLFGMKGKTVATAFHAASEHLSHVSTKDMSMYDVRPIVLDREKYAESVQQYAFSISTSPFESFGLFYVELMLSGVIVMFLDRPWVQKLIPGYKLVASQQELSALAWEVRKNYAKWYGYLEKEIIPFLRENYLIKNFATKMMERIG